jgi:transcriptional regulator with XRE-family HTH domain
MDISKKFGQNVKALRLSKNLSQGKLAKRLNVNPSYISQIERGVSNLSLKGIEKLAKALRVKMEELIK